MEETGLDIGQTFATGAAATLLAGHAEVREVLGPSLVKDYEEIRALHEKFKMGKKDFNIREPLVKWIRDKFKGETGPAKKQTILAKAIELTLVSDDTKLDSFPKRLRRNLTTLASPDTGRLLSDLKTFMKNQLGYQD